MIEVTDLGYQYSRKEPIFDNLNVHFQPGKIYGLLGKNGAGKSTLIKNLTGMLFPTSGNCSVFGHTPQTREVDFLKDLFFVPEEYYLPKITIRQLIRTYHKFYPNFDIDQFNRYLKVFGIQSSRKTTQLSLGQKKKVLIGFALSANSRVLILDEPTNGLDIPSKITFRKMIGDAFRKDRIVIITSHQVRDLDELIDTIIIIDQGRILLNEHKDDISRKWRFDLATRPAQHTETIYEEKVSNGYASISENTQGHSGYVDIELLFNATLSHQIHSKHPS